LLQQVDTKVEYLRDSDAAAHAAALVKAALAFGF